jgi:subtilisin family serine protease
MRLLKYRKLTLVALLLLSALVALPVGAVGRPAQVLSAQGGRERFVVLAKSSADLAGLRADVGRAGGTIVRDLAQVNALVVVAPSSFKGQIGTSPRLSAVARDRAFQLRPPDGQALTSPKRTRTKLSASGSIQAVDADPAFDLPGLMWNLERIHAPQAWETTTGDPDVLVGVADTGLDYTHAEIDDRVVHVQDFTVNEDPPLCKTFFGTSDQELAAEFGGPADGDWNGHGSWIGGNIAAEIDGSGVNGIAPDISLVALKISQWCGSSYLTTEIESFLWAADNGVDIVSISFGGYLDRSDPEQDALYRVMALAVTYAHVRGTVIVSSAGNEHLRIGDGGQVLSHGPLTAPGEPFEDLFGFYETPAGLPKVVNVGSTNNAVGAPSPSCPSGTTGTNATCKPTSDPHQPFGVGTQNQLAYYSNYGPRIDVVAPGGARKFNLPVWDRGGTPGWPVTTADGFTAWQTFSINSNWSVQIPCYLIDLPGFAPDQCYTTIQGTSMATPHVSAVLALAVSAHPELRHRPRQLVAHLKATAQDISGNTTPPLSATDTSGGDLTGGTCPSGYCHLGGAPIPDADAYGAGLVDAASAVE